MKKPSAELATKKYIVTINLGATLGPQIYRIAENQGVPITVLVRLILRKVLAEGPSLVLAIAGTQAE